MLNVTVSERMYPRRHGPTDRTVSSLEAHALADRLIAKVLHRSKYNDFEALLIVEVDQEWAFHYFTEALSYLITDGRVEVRHTAPVPNERVEEMLVHQPAVAT